MFWLNLNWWHQASQRIAPPYIWRTPRFSYNFLGWEMEGQVWATLDYRRRPRLMSLLLNQLGTAWEV